MRKMQESSQIQPKRWMILDGMETSTSFISKMPFPPCGLWIADDRILGRCNMETGALTELIFHGRQPQSANAFILRHPQQAVALSIQLGRRNGQVVAIKHRFERVHSLPYAWQNEFAVPGGVLQTKLHVHRCALIWNISFFADSEEIAWFAPSLSLTTDGLNQQVNGRRTWGGPTWDGNAVHFLAHDLLHTKDWINVEGFSDKLIDAQVALLIAGEPDSCTWDGHRLLAQPAQTAQHCWSQSVSFYIVCADDADRARAELASLRQTSEQHYRETKVRYHQRAVARPQLDVAGYPFAASVYALAPLYIEAAKVVGSGSYRSTTGGYYFVWGWDNLVAGHELGRVGDGEAARAMLEFFATHRGADGSLPHRFDNDLSPLQTTGYGFTSLLFISLLYQVVTETLDRALLRRYFPLAEEIFDAMAAKIEANGLFRSLGMYPDAPLKLGRSSDSVVAYENGFWYTACRMMEVLARLVGRETIAVKACGIARHIYQQYLDVFYVAERGFLVDAVDAMTGKTNDTFARYSLFPTLNSYGAWLLRPRGGEIARFLAEETWTESGIRMVPDWDVHAYTETVTSPCWFLHFDVYTLKIWRRHGFSHMLLRWLALAESYFHHAANIPELQMLERDDLSQRRWDGPAGQAWQLFAATGWLRGLLEGIAGIETDIGGLSYVVCDLSIPITVRNLPFRGARWDILVTGKGAWIDRMTVDGIAIAGVCKIPVEWYTPGRHRWEIVRAEHAPKTPMLLEVIGAGVRAPQIEDGCLSLNLQGYGEVNLLYYAPSAHTVVCAGKPVECLWNPRTGIGVIDLSVIGEELLHITV